MNLGAYLDRIRFVQPLRTDATTLRALHRAHMLTVPFENLDIHAGRRIDLSLPKLFDKIVRRRRGGFCYELNGLFAWALSEIGFWVQLHSARVWGAKGPSREFDHLVLQVFAERNWLADVGFGESFLEPLPLEASTVTDEQFAAYRLVQSEDDWTLERRQHGADWQPQYVFTLVPRRLSDFDDMCTWHQTDPGSHFTQNRICTLPTDTGRITLSGHRLIVTRGSVREEREVSDEEQTRLLRDRFGITLA
jgi:N-hydroxyarylamine O-acetyltransferase